MYKKLLLAALPLIMIACNQNTKTGTTNSAAATDTGSGFRFINGYPADATIQKVYDEADLNRAIQCYRFFYPTVSMKATWEGNLSIGMVPNKIAGILDGTPQQLVFTPNSDTKYSGLIYDMSESGPVVVELPPGPLMCAINDLNQLWVMDLGLPGPDKGKGGKHLVIPPGYKGAVPAGYYTGQSSTNRFLLMLRALPPDGKAETAIALMKSVKIYPLNKNIKWPELQWIDLNKPGLDFTPVRWENNLDFWKQLYDVVNTEAVYEPYRAMYGELAELGIEKGKPFNPDARMKSILEQAAKTGNAIMRVQSFADRRPDKLVWNDRKWEWAVLRDKNGTFDIDNYTDLYAREKWFYQAQIESPAMFNRSPGAGSLYWLGIKDNTGAYLDGGKTYKLTVPLPVPGKLFWSITIYDNESRSEIATDQNKAALRSLTELKGLSGNSVDLYFGSSAPAGKENVWIKTIPNKGWFSYFRIYGPEAPAFNGSWKPGDFEEVK